MVPAGGRKVATTEQASDNGENRNCIVGVQTPIRRGFPKTLKTSSSCCSSCLGGSQPVETSTRARWDKPVRYLPKSVISVGPAHRKQERRSNNASIVSKNTSLPDVITGRIPFSCTPGQSHMHAGTWSREQKPRFVPGAGPRKKRAAQKILAEPRGPANLYLLPRCSSRERRLGLVAGTSLSVPPSVTPFQELQHLKTTFSDLDSTLAGWTSLRVVGPLQKSAVQLGRSPGSALVPFDSSRVRGILGLRSTAGCCRCEEATTLTAKPGRRGGHRIVRGLFLAARVFAGAAADWFRLFTGADRRANKVFPGSVCCSSCQQGSDVSLGSASAVWHCVYPRRSAACMSSAA